VGKRQVEVSNLDKALFPSDHILKAHLIEYYLKVAPTLLAHARGRPLSLVRYPDGIGGESFFQKNRPGWAPEWIEHVTLGEQESDYVIVTEEASLVWLANLACIELHQMHSRAPHFDRPDYVAYDFDPPDGFPFAKVAELALEFKTHLERFGYHPFVKTTGRKGLHILTPIEPRWDFHEAFEAARAVAQPFVESHASLTLQIKKDQRKGRVLLDIYRNRSSQTIVAAYSVRGLPRAPVSTPLTWAELDAGVDPGEFNLRTLPDRLARDGDPWEAFSAYATALHTKPAAKRARKSLKPARTYKTREQLAAYSAKRSFERTPEPPADKPVPSGAGNAFVIHRHHASRLHYDLRLERDGVLRSWAVPKGLPPRPGIKRLAVNVEDHPLEYVDFEGAIPRGEYGGGMMWKFARGRYEITKEKADGFYFRLHSRELDGEYRMHRTKENQWLLERVDTPPSDPVREFVAPMLARAADRVPRADHIFEVKWDGIRAMISLDEGAVRIRGRNGIDITEQFPELLIPEQAFRAASALFDGEIVCLNADGRPNFRDVIFRMQQRSEGAIGRARVKHPAVCYLFDCLYLDGRAVMNEPLVRRREWLEDALRDNPAYRVSQAMEEGETFFEAVREMGLEGMMAKQRTGPYLPGKRSDCWLKLKTRRTMECVIIGYTRGKGDREKTFGALHIARWKGPELEYLGKVGGGFDETSLAAVWGDLRKLTPGIRPVKDRLGDGAGTVWVEPRLVCEVQFSSITSDGRLREPVFLRMRPDLMNATITT